ncbi:MAG: DNRLRE domain-containing protein, partial [Thermoplasmata archaeon]
CSTPNNRPKLIVEYMTGTRTSVTAYASGQDTYIAEATPSTNYGSSSVLQAGAVWGNDECHTLVQISLSSVPAYSTIHAAYLRLYEQEPTVAFSPQTDSYYPIKISWNENSVTWYSMPLNYYDSAYMQTKVIRSRSGYNSFDITTLVQKWVNNEMPNYGITIRDYDLDGFAYFYSKEGQGNNPPTPTIFVMYTPDTTPPTSSASVISGDLGNNGWYVLSDVVVRITGSDSESGVGTIKYGTTSPPTNSFAGSSYDYTVTNDGQTTIYYQAIDRAGNAGSIGSILIKRDTAQPICSASIISGTMGTNGWYVSDVTLRITASDATSGVDTIYYGEEFEPPNSYQGTTYDYIINTNGNHRIAYWATDKAGYQCLEQCIDIKIDKTIPTCTATVTSGTLGTNGWYVSNVVLNISGTDTYSGIKGIYYGTTPTPSNFYAGSSYNYAVNTDGTFTIYYRVIDNAGNNGTVNSIVIKRDATLPTVSSSIVSGTHPPCSSWSITDVTLRITGSDATSGVNSIWYGSTSPPTISYIGSSYDYTITAEGVHNIYYRARDNAGNNGSIGVTSISIDKTAPTSTATVISGTLGNNGWYVSNPVVRITGSDLGSGVRALYIGTTTPPINSYMGTTCDYTFSTDGTYTLYYRALDNAGNNGTVNSIIIRVDKTAPQNPIIDIGFDDTNYWFVGSYIYYSLLQGQRQIFVNVTLDELTSGISYVSCTCTNTVVDSTPADGFKFTFSFATCATTPYNITIQAEDNAGNILNYTYVLLIVCDNTPPTCSIVAPDLITDNSQYSVSVISSDNNSDFPSGISNTYLDYFNSDSGIPTSPRSSMNGANTEGIYFYRAYSVDNVSNPSEIVSKKVIVDRTSPNAFLSEIIENSDFITVSGNTIYYSGLGNSAFTICIDASDNVGLFSISGSNAFGDTPSLSVNGTSYHAMLNYTIEQGSTWTGLINITITDIAGHNFTISVNVEIASPLIPTIKEISFEIYTGVICYNSSINTLFFESNTSGVLTIYIEVDNEANAIHAEGSSAFGDSPYDNSLEPNSTFCIVYTIEEGSVSPTSISITVFNNVGESASVSFSVRKLNDLSASIFSVAASDNIDYDEETNTVWYPDGASAWFTVSVHVTGPGISMLSAEGDTCFGDHPQGIVQNSFVYAFMYTVEQGSTFEGPINFTFKDAVGRCTSSYITVRIIKEFAVQFAVTETTGGEFLYYEPVGTKLYYGTGACSFSIIVSAIFYQSNYMKAYGSSAFGDNPTQETNSLPLILNITYTIEAGSTYSGTITITAEDEFGRKETFNLNVIHDCTPPSGLGINAPAISNGTPYLVTVQNAYDSESGMLGTFLGVFSQDFGEPTLECNSLAGNITEGVYYYRAVAVDRVGNKANVSMKTIVDLTPPIADITEIERESGILEIMVNDGNWYVQYGKDGGSFVVTVHAHDSCGISNCTLRNPLSSDLELTQITPSGSSFVLYFTADESKNSIEGQITLLVYDLAGRYTELKFNVSRVTQPLGAVTLNATREGKDVILKWTEPKSNARIVSYEIYRDSTSRPATLLTTVSAENQLRYIDVSQTKCAYYLVVAVDVFGNKGADVNGVYVPAFQETKETESEFPWWLLGLALVCLGVVFAFVVIYVTKKRKQTAHVMPGYYQSAYQTSPSVYNAQYNAPQGMQSMQAQSAVTPTAQPVYTQADSVVQDKDVQQIPQHGIQQNKAEQKEQKEALISHAVELQRR